MSGTAHDRATCAETGASLFGRSGANRRHVDRRGCPVYVVTDYYTLDKVVPPKIRENETKAFAERLRRRKEKSP